MSFERTLLESVPRKVYLWLKNIEALGDLKLFGILDGSDSSLYMHFPNIVVELNDSGGIIQSKKNTDCFIKWEGLAVDPKLTEMKKGYGFTITEQLDEFISFEQQIYSDIEELEIKTRAKVAERVLQTPETDSI